MKNVKVNSVENILTESDVIISRTDAKGLITYVSPPTSQEFQNILWKR